MEMPRISNIDPNPLAEIFKAREVVGGRVESPYVIRLDGVGFSRALIGFEEPRDERVHRALVEGCVELMKFFNADFCYVVSDEVNLFIFRYTPYSGRMFKIVSVSSSILSSSVSLMLGRKLYFDSRIVSLPDVFKAIPYFLYRVRVGFGNYVSKLYSMHISKKSVSVPQMVKELESKGISIAMDWRSFGTCIHVEKYVKKGYDPISGREAVSLRRRYAESSDIDRCLRTLVEIAKSMAI